MRAGTTVAEFRVKWATLGGEFEPLERDATQNPRSAKTWCTWTAQPGPDENLPINCLARDTAQLYCKAAGGDLPSEAQLEFVASGRGREQGYAWGDDEPACADAVWGLGGGGGLGSATTSSDDTCRPSSALGGVNPAGSGARDRVTLVDEPTQTSREVLDLAGNVAEWSRDAWNRLTEPYWASPGVLTDPVATTPSAADPDLLYVVRAGNWTNAPYQLRAGYREGAPEAVSYGIGFRCAYPAQ